MSMFMFMCEFFHACFEGQLSIPIERKVRTELNFMRRRAYSNFDQGVN
jgi:hypothetical protein